MVGASEFWFDQKYRRQSTNFVHLNHLRRSTIIITPSEPYPSLSADGNPPVYETGRIEDTNEIESFEGNAI